MDGQTSDSISESPIFNDIFSRSPCLRSSTVFLKGKTGSDQSVSVSYYWKNVFVIKFLIDCRFLRQNYNFWNSIKSDSNSYHDLNENLCKGLVPKYWFTTSRDSAYDAVVLSIILAILVKPFFVRKLDWTTGFMVVR